ncbi:MAG: HAD family hydrolase [Bacillota bacterium]|jgi:phosphoglycolate phosphatase-like HAD superfamily hydrolase
MGCLLSHFQGQLQNFQPGHPFFVGVDSDGCVFDTMEIKQKECFCPVIIRFWGLQPIAKYVRETVEFVNLYSKWRGTNRFLALLKLFDYLSARPEVQAKGVELPRLRSLRQWAASGAPLGNAGLQAEVTRTADPDLLKVLEWSKEVNEAVAAIAVGILPFAYVRECLAQLTQQADIICVSQTPAEALEREWAANDLAPYAAIIAGQEHGSKQEQLDLTAGGKYPADHVLMVGDALGDLQAARAAGALFYPINPGKEDVSWQRFYQEAMPKFFNQTYAGSYEAKLIAAFRTCLPEEPPWQS